MRSSSALAVAESAHWSPDGARFHARVNGIGLAATADMGDRKRFVYVLTSSWSPNTFYVGVTGDVPARLAVHNDGQCVHTRRHRPWRLHVVIEFAEEATALRFERYLKSGSGRAFAKRHFSTSSDSHPRRVPTSQHEPDGTA